MDATPACAKQHSKPPLSEEVVMGAGGTLANVFVYVKSGLPAGKTWPIPAKAMTVTQVGCIYQPHVLGAMVGQNVEFLNEDPTSHNVHPLPKINNEWNQSQPPKGDPIVRTFSKPEIGLPIKCNLHPWMRVYVNVVPHPFFAVTGADGSFSIKGLPAGDYTLAAWHERFGVQEFKVKVAANGTAAANFTFK
jgi:plastocyanin